MVLSPATAGRLRPRVLLVLLHARVPEPLLLLLDGASSYTLLLLPLPSSPLMLPPTLLLRVSLLSLSSWTLRRVEPFALSLLLNDERKPMMICFVSSRPSPVAPVAL